MLSIRFARVGKRNKAQFKIMLQESTEAPGGRHIEILGSWDPHQKVAVLKDERIKYWLSKGAQTSDTVHNLLITKGVISGKKIAVKLPEKEVTDVPEEPKQEVAEVAKEEAKTEEPKEKKKEEPKEESKEKTKQE